jgi:hypothetical protein
VTIIAAVTAPSVVIAGLDPAIHQPLYKLFAKRMDARVKPAHDDSTTD